jgi:hypothetical protein
LDRGKYSKAPKLLQKKAELFVTSRLEPLVGRIELRKALPSIHVRLCAAAILTSYLLFVLNGNLIGTSSTSTRSLSSADEVRIFDTSGSKQDGRPVSIPRLFVQGEIPNFAQASIAGSPVLTQCDAKNRWPDGSLKFAIVSFIVPIIPANGSVFVAFSNQSSGNNATYLNQAEMLEPVYDFESTIEMSGATTQTISARQMLSSGAVRYWLQGPIVTAVVLEDRTSMRTYDKDFGDGSKALHPIFEAWFYPNDHKVQLGSTAENTWVSGDAAHDMRDLRYGLTLRAGKSNPVVKFSEGPFIHNGASRWHRSFWLGKDPSTIRVDHNRRYLARTKALPNYDPDLNVDGSLISEQYASWKNSKRRALDGDASGVGNFDKGLSGGGAADWIGLANLWDTLYFLTMDDRMREKSLGNADLAGRIPWHFREADSRAGSGHFFDDAHTVDTLGRVVSVNARVQVTLSDLSEDCDGAIGADKIKTGPIGNEGWATTRDHMPDLAYLPYLLTGQHYYLEEIQYQAAFIIGWKIGCITPAYSYPRQGSAGYLNDTQLRGEAWALRTLSYAAFISPDGSPEKAYFEDKLRNNIARWEGAHDVSLSDQTRLQHWSYGKNRQLDSRGLSPLGSWGDRGSEFVQAPVKTDGSLGGAASPWEENFMTIALGIARDFGYPTEGLLKFQAKRLFNQVLNPETNHILIEAYRYPTITKANRWIQTWQENDSYYAALPSAWRALGSETPDHSYGFIAMSAISFVYPYSSGTYRGADAWDFIRKKKPNQQTLATQSPKWDIVPRKE